TAEALIMQYEFKADLANYLATRPGARIRGLADLIRFNQAHADQELPYFGQERLVQSEARGPLTDGLYLRALDHTTTFGRSFARLFDEQNFAALVAPTNAPAWAIDLLNGDHVLGGSAKAAAVCGFPLITVPAGFVADLLPIGLTFMGPAMTEPTLVKLAYAFEQAQPVRRAPAYAATTLGFP
ncbi:MAG: amidase family protein, partial [Chloroflexota bacterium]|nr:amidase family protein [Chloroflexota bacterium]